MVSWTNCKIFRLKIGLKMQAGKRATKFSKVIGNYWNKQTKTPFSQLFKWKGIRIYTYVYIYTHMYFFFDIYIYTYVFFFWYIYIHICIFFLIVYTHMYFLIESISNSPFRNILVDHLPQTVRELWPKRWFPVAIAAFPISKKSFHQSTTF